MSSTFRFLFLLFLSLMISHRSSLARPVSRFDNTVTVTTNNTNDTWHDFGRFIDVERGSQVSGISELKKYFHRFGYLTNPDTNFTDMFDVRFESAVGRYQAKLGLPVTGKLDTGTLSQIMSPRCGVRDVPHHKHVTRHYSYFAGRPQWGRSRPMLLTYSFSPSVSLIDYIGPSNIKPVFERSFARWSTVIPVNFSYTEDYASADVKIGFYGDHHGDGEPFDGVLGILAHAFSPESGMLHFDKAETWAVDFKKEKSKVAVDLESVATHEIGHVLGLAHSSVREAVMYPSLAPRTKKFDLSLDDVEGVQALYGSNPNFNISSLIESERSTGTSAGTKYQPFVRTVFLGVLLPMVLRV